MKTRYWSLILVAAVALSPNPTIGKQDPSPVSPHLLSHATEVIDLLNKNDLKVLVVGQSHFSGFLGTQKMAAFIKTDKGIVEVVFLDDDIPTDKVTISYQKGTGSSNHHLYKVSAAGTNRKIENLSAAYPIYFTVHDRWIVITSDGQLDKTIKHALRQTYPG